MALEKTEKQPFERYFVYGDFSEVLDFDNDETIDLLSAFTTVTAVDSAGADASVTVIDTPTITADNEEGYLWVRIKDGVDQEVYTFTIRVETSAGNRFEVDGNIVVKEIPAA